ncbi:MAG: hypothetical protein ACJ788_01930 [Ktedonobacteraceae bacterium]
MNDDHTQHQPVEPTTPVPPPGNPYTNPYASSYVDGPIGIPPPPPSLLPPPLPEKPRRSVIVLGIVLAIALLLFASAGLYALARSYQVSKEQPTPIVHFTSVTPTAPTYQRDLLATDFPTFISGFRQAITANDIQTLSTVEDGVHFTEQCDMADTSCTNDWNTTKAQLTKNEIKLLIPSDFSSVNNPPAASVCQSVEPEPGNAWIFVSGTYSQTANLVVPTNGPAVFGFQQPAVGSPWTWDALILNMSSC